MSISTGLAPGRARREISKDPFRLFGQRLNRLFEEPYLSPFLEENWALAGWTPVCDVFETDNEIVVKTELPGVKKEDVHITMENGLLAISGERKFEEETKRENYHRVERSYGEFYRSFSLPTTVDVNKINAEFKDGVLKIMLPRLEEAKRKSVDIKVK
ncbi:MAG TPA: Hsp20/alpha crystallin family protein [Blastocatellia bacterium]|nr:Hsp20/alpha crystallin family protein [Blastocatellia bacterium]